jgi:hypothetical protein
MSEPVTQQPGTPAPNSVVDIEKRLDTIFEVLGEMSTALSDLAKKIEQPPATTPADSSANTVSTILAGIETALTLYGEIHAATAKK